MEKMTIHRALSELKLIHAKIKVNISAYAWPIRRHHSVGYIDLSVEKPTFVYIEDWCLIERIIKSSLGSCVSNYTTFVSHKEAVALIDEEKKVMDKINERIKSIPRIIRWLFKIKK